MRSAHHERGFLLQTHSIIRLILLHSTGFRPESNVKSGREPAGIRKSATKISTGRREHALPFVLCAAALLRLTISCCGRDLDPGDRISANAPRLAEQKMFHGSREGVEEKAACKHLAHRYAPGRQQIDVKAAAVNSNHAAQKF